MLILTLRSFAQHTSTETENHSEEFIQTFDSLLYSNELDKAYYLLSEESGGLLGEEMYSDRYFSFLYKKMKELYKKGNYIESISVARDFISKYNKSDTLLAYTYTYLANSYYRFDDFDIALDCYFTAKQIHNKDKRYKEVAKIVSNIGLIYFKLKNYERALSCYDESNHIFLDHGLSPYPYNYNQLGRINIRLENYDQAALYLDSAKSLAIAQRNKNEEFYSTRSMGLNLYTQERYAEAIPYYEAALAGYRSINARDHALDCIEQLALINIQLKNYDQAISLCEKHLPTAYNTNNLRHVVSMSEIMYDALVAQGNYKEAVYIHQNFQQAKDSIEIRQEESNKYKVQMRLEAEKRANENELLKEQKKVNEETIRAQNILLYSIGIGLLLVVIIALIIYRSYLINKQLSAKIQLQSDRLKQLDEAKSRFFANISHDLRTPLTLIMGGIEQVLKSEDMLLTDKAERQLKTGLLNGERIIHLTNEINELIKLEDGKLVIHRQYIDLDKMLKLFVKMFDSMAELKGIHLSYSKSIFEGAPIAHIDPTQFEKVLFNLITNALKHTQKDDSVTVALNKEDENLIVSVIDSGEGIPEQNLPYIFERYYQSPDTTFKTQEGFGIGLALVKEIINKHEAAILVKSKLGEGSEFMITIHQELVNEDQITQLPHLEYSDKTRGLFRELDEAESDSKPVINLNRRVSNTKPTILIVEDHPEVREFIQAIVETRYHVLTAPNGQRALKVLDKEAVDLIITDLMMPWFDGFELLEKLKESDKLKKIPALVLSARTSEEDKTKVLSQGVNDFLCKPFKPNELLQRIENLLDKKEIWNNNNEGALFINNQQTLDEIEQSLLKKVEQLVLDKIDDPTLSIHYLADHIAVSERKFYRMIKKMTNGTPFEFIKEVRMQYASRILKEKNVSSASEVAKSIGMNNVSHFNTQFKKRFGKSPMDYK
ncbi:response regulator [Reichenbachiella carrageenanivorans]|uniref:histidine kinase n=1 Tax=Reichenbachiella carrageenanivorans TaxID=2979869 RepID=A0ABY6D0G8_9BACT|nr:response regulator [Reichenbachiella carrageenanivorans]UXX78553.1 response regulator [Reichenbachiella carrageenanivorans]